MYRAALSSLRCLLCCRRSFLAGLIISLTCPAAAHSHLQADTPPRAQRKGAHLGIGTSTPDSPEPLAAPPKA